MSKVLIMDEWIKDLQEDANLGGALSNEGVAYILYGLYKYNVEGEKPDLGVFGEEYGVLNYVMPGLYKQIDKMKSKGNNRGEKKVTKYDNDAIRELAEKGLGPKAICIELGYDESVAKSLSSNKGYKEGREKYKNGGKVENIFDF